MGPSERSRIFILCYHPLQASIARDTYKTLETEELVKGYRRNDHQLCCFKNYTLTYTQYSKIPAKPQQTAKPDQFARPII